MNLRNSILLALVIVGMSSGQILFKMASMSMNGRPLDLLSLLNPSLIGALIIYGVATLLWVYLLREVPLNVAYPFVALSFVIVPLLSQQIFGELYSWRTLAGSAIIIFGIFVSNS